MAFPFFTANAVSKCEVSYRGGAVAPFEGAEFPEFPMQTKLRMRRQEGGLAGGGREKPAVGIDKVPAPHPTPSAVRWFRLPQIVQQSL